MRCPLRASVFPSENLRECAHGMRPQASEWVLPARWRSAMCGPRLTEHLLCRQGSVTSRLLEISQPLGCPAARTEPQSQLPEAPRVSHGSRRAAQGPILVVRCRLPPPSTLASSLGELGTTSPKGSLNPGAPSAGELGSQAQGNPDRRMITESSPPTGLGRDPSRRPPAAPDAEQGRGEGGGACSAAAGGGGLRESA